VPPGPDHHLTDDATSGCFVSLHDLRNHRLRGCVGRIDPRGEPLHTLIPAVAQSCLHDPRFERDPVTLHELPRLAIELTLLSPLTDAAHPLDFDPHTDGLLLTLGEASGCYLPQVARETGWSREQLLDRLCSEKLGLDRDAWRRPEARMQTFRTEIVGPEPFEPLG
jgi:AmmeMemoRadiSam system protein A